MSKYCYFNPNPQGNRVGDCTVRALCKALNKDWDSVHAMLSLRSFALKDMQSANRVWGAVLKRNGFKRYLVDDNRQDIYTVRDFCEDNPEGTFILAIDSHVVCVVDGCYYDSWDSGDEIPIYYWKR